MQEDSRARDSRGRRWWYLVLILPFIATLFPQLYNSSTPTLMGLPYFYWYQLLWVLLAGLLTIFVYSLTK